MNLDCSILLEDKQRFKSGGVMCVDYILFYACFYAHLHTLSMLDLCIFILPAFLLAYLLFWFGDLLFVHFLYTGVDLVKNLHLWASLGGNKGRKHQVVYLTRSCTGMERGPWGVCHQQKRKMTWPCEPHTAVSRFEANQSRSLTWPCGSTRPCETSRDQAGCGRVHHTAV